MAGRVRVASIRRWALAALCEIIVLAVAWRLYRYGRFKVRDQRLEAFSNAADVVDFEKQAHIFFEPSIQRLALESRTVIDVLNHYYAYMHVIATAGCLFWLYVWHRPTYRQFRWVLFAVMPLGLLIHAVYPLAPPRFVPTTRMLDTLAAFGPSVYSRDQFASSTNQFAAMPSFHVGWSILVAYFVIKAGRSRLRWVALAHALVMTLAVLATANHYVVDAAVGALLMVVAIDLNVRFSTRAGGPLQSGQPPPAGQPLNVLA